MSWFESIHPLKGADARTHAMHDGARLVCVCLVLAALALSCSRLSCSRPLSLAIGPAGDVTIITTLPDDSPEVTALVDGLEREIVIIRPEWTFTVEVSDPSGFGIRRNWRNLIFLGTLDEDSWVSDMIESLLSEQLRGELANGRRNMFLLEDEWATGQMVAVVASARREGLAQAVRDNLESLYENLDRAAVENTHKIMLRKDLQRSLASQLQERYGWSILLPKGYRGIQDPDHRVARFKMEEPSRVVLVHWQDGFSGALTPGTCLALRATLAWNYYDEDRIDHDMTYTTQTSFLGRDAIKIEGIWQNEKHVTGGPFRTYCFVAGDRLYLLDLVVFSPATEKLPYLRELEAIASTFAAG